MSCEVEREVELYIIERVVFLSIVFLFCFVFCSTSPPSTGPVLPTTLCTCFMFRGRKQERRHERRGKTGG